MARLPHVTSQIPRDLRQYVDRVREALNQLERRAAALERTASSTSEATSVSSSAISVALSGLGPTIIEAVEQEYATPPAPTGLTVTGAFSTVILDWDPATYFGHAYTEVWAGTTNVLGDAIMVGQTPGSVFSHTLGESATRYYWIRFVNVVDVKGPYNAVSGEEGSTAENPEYLIEVLAEEYGTGSAAPFFQIDQPTTINGVSIPAGTYIKQGYIADATINRAKIQDAAIDTAKISDLAVTDAKISELDAGKITTGFLDADRIDTDAITADKIDSRNLSIQDGAGNIIFSAGYDLDFSRVTGAGAMASIDNINTGNVSTYISGAAIGTAQIGTAAITSAKIGTAEVETLKVAGNAITLPTESDGSLLVGSGFVDNAVTEVVQIPAGITGNIRIFWGIQHGYGAGARFHGWRLKVNGTVVDSRGTFSGSPLQVTNGPQDISDYIQGQYTAFNQTGNVSIVLEWGGEDSGISVQTSRLTCFLAKR